MVVALAVVGGVVYLATRSTDEPPPAAAPVAPPIDDKLADCTYNITGTSDRDGLYRLSKLRLPYGAGLVNVSAAAPEPDGSRVYFLYVCSHRLTDEQIADVGTVAAKKMLDKWPDPTTVHGIVIEDVVNMNFSQKTAATACPLPEFGTGPEVFIHRDKWSTDISDVPCLDS